VSSEEFLQYAVSNRKEWEARGESVVATLAEEARKKYGVKDTPRLEESMPVDATADC
jgi:hypothetical protein